MSRTKKTDAWVASVRISIPINAQDAFSIQRAQESVARLEALIPGCTAEVTHAGFGKMVPAPLPPGVIVTHVPASATAGDTVTAQPEIPTFLRRNGTGPSPGSPLDPSGDGSFRGPDGAA